MGAGFVSGGLCPRGSGCVPASLCGVSSAPPSPCAPSDWSSLSSCLSTCCGACCFAFAGSVRAASGATAVSACATFFTTAVSGASSGASASSAAGACHSEAFAPRGFFCYACSVAVCGIFAPSVAPDSTPSAAFAFSAAPGSGPSSASSRSTGIFRSWLGQRRGPRSSHLCPSGPGAC